MLGPIIFSLFCNELPDLAQDTTANIHMYADDTTIYVVGPTSDTAATILNTSLKRLYDWCHFNLLTPHPEKTEFMLKRLQKFHWPTTGDQIREHLYQAIFFHQCLFRTLTPHGVVSPLFVCTKPITSQAGHVYNFSGKILDWRENPDTCDKVLFCCL